MKLEERKIEDGGREGIYFYAYSSSGKKYSIVNVARLMETCLSYDNDFLSKHFNYWEAMELKDNGELNHEVEPIRAKSWEELQKLLLIDEIE